MKAFLIWYIATLLLSVLFLPLGRVLFPRWRDGGWIILKSLGLFFGGYLLWTLNCLHLVRFTGMAAVLCVLAAAAVCAAVYARSYLAGKGGAAVLSVPVIVFEELAFFVLIAVWTYIIGFNPEAYGTEKFMDYAFITAMMRTD